MEGWRQIWELPKLTVGVIGQQRFLGVFEMLYNQLICDMLKNQPFCNLYYLKQIKIMIDNYLGVCTHV